MHSEATSVYILQLQTLKWYLAKFQTGLKFCDPPEEVEGFVLQHQGAVARQVKLLQSARKRVWQRDLIQLVAA